jgi:hypothetical protein
MTNNIEKDINRIRIEIYEETKDMTQEQRKERLRRIVDTAEKEYGFQRIASAKHDHIQRRFV